MGSNVVVSHQKQIDALVGQFQKGLRHMQDGYEAAQEAFDGLMQLEAWKALGHKDAETMFASLVAGARLKPEARQPIEKMLIGQGFSLRSVAAVTGTSKSQVARDVKQLSHMGQLDKPKVVTGTDGKSYSKTPKPKPDLRPVDSGARFDVMVTDSMGATKTMYRSLAKAQGQREVRSLKKDGAYTKVEIVPAGTQVTKVPVINSLESIPTADLQREIERRIDAGDITAPSYGGDWFGRMRWKLWEKAGYGPKKPPPDISAYEIVNTQQTFWGTTAKFQAALQRDLKSRDELAQKMRGIQ